MSGFYAKGENFDRLFINQQQFADQFLGNQIYTWGAVNSGELGSNAATARSSPGDVVAAAKSNSWNKLARSLGAIKTDGSLWVWGSNTTGRLGDGTTVNRSSPVTVAGGGVWVAASGGSTSMGIKNDGTLWCWGTGGTGAIGDNTTISKSSPVTTAGGGNNWTLVSTLSINSVCAAKSDGTVWCWGLGSFGRLGNGTTTNKSSPSQTLHPISNWRQIACADVISFALSTDGTLWSWGYGGVNGQLGDGTTINKSSPVTVLGGSNWKYVSAATQSAAAIKTDGTLWTWGNNNSGNLGDGTTINRSSPGTVAGGGTNWKIISGITFCMAGIKTDGSLWTWGQGTNGQLGTGTTSNGRSSPATVIASAINNWINVAGQTLQTGTNFMAIAQID